MNPVARFVTRLTEFEILPQASPDTFTSDALDVPYRQFQAIGVDLKSMSFLGNGQYGAVFDIGDGRIVKLTTDTKEADVSAYVKTLGLRYVWRIDHVYELTQPQVDAIYHWRKDMQTFAPKHLNAIVGERLNLFTDKLNYKVASRWLSKTVGIAGSQSLNAGLYQRLRGFLDTFERRGEVSGWVPPDPKEGSAWVQYARFIVEALWELNQHDVAFADFHKNNVMYRGNDMVLVDIGLSRSPRKGELELLAP